MDIYQSTVEYLADLPIVKSWPEMQVLIGRAASMKTRHWRVPITACEAVGGVAEESIPAVAAIACAHSSIMLIDDMLDEDPRGEYHHIGSAKAANFAVAFQAAGLEAIFVSKAPLETKLKAMQSLNKMLMATAFGQDLDIRNPTDEAAYWRVAETKSAPFFGAALHLGALIGGASDDVAGRLEHFGQLYGVMIQVHDDLNDSMAVPANSDWIQRRSPLPILFAQSVDHPARSRFVELCRDVSGPEALQEAQDILIRSGAVSYCVDQLVRRHQAAREILNTIPLAHRDGMENFLEGVLEPVRKLFTSIGKLPPVLSGARRT